MSRQRRRLAGPCACILAGALALAGCGGGSGPENLDTGLAELRRGNLDRAIRCLRRACDQLPENPSAFANLGIARWRAGQFEKAAEAFEQARALSGDDVRVLEFLGRIYTEIKRFPEARQALEAARARAPSPRIATALGAVDYLDGNDDDAQQLWNEVLQTAPSFAPALYNMAVLYRDKREDPERAAIFYRRYSQVSDGGAAVPSLQEFLAGGAAAPAPGGGPPPAPVVEPGGGPAAGLLAAARESVAREIFDEALLLLDQAAHSDPANADVVWEQATIYERHIGDRAAAMRFYRRFAQQFPQDSRAAVATQLLQAWEVRTPGSPAADRAPVWPWVETTATADPAAARRAAAEGDAALGAGDLDGAVLAYTRALVFDREHFAAAYNMGYAHRQARRPELARDAFLYALRVNPELHEARYMLAMIHRELGDSPHAAEEAQKVLTAQPDHARAHLLLGLTYADMNRATDARRHFERYLQLDPTTKAAETARTWLQQHPPARSPSAPRGRRRP